MELFDYIEVFYNQRRRHSMLGQISRAAFERRANEEGVEPVVFFNEERTDNGERSTQRNRPPNRIMAS